MKKFFLILPVFLLVSCSSAGADQAVVETLPVVTFVLPPKWTDTPTPAPIVVPTETPTAELTATQTLTFAVTPLPSGILARPASAAEVDAGNSLWTLTKFTELTAPGVKRYAVRVAPGSNWVWDCYFCAKEEVYLPYIDAISVKFRVAGQYIPDEALGIFDRKGAEGWQCRTWAAMLSGWPANTTFELEIRSTFTQAVSDGRNEYPAGEYRHVITVLVEQ